MIEMICRHVTYSKTMSLQFCELIPIKEQSKNKLRFQDQQN